MLVFSLSPTLRAISALAVSLLLFLYESLPLYATAGKSTLVR